MPPELWHAGSNTTLESQRYRLKPPVGRKGLEPTSTTCYTQNPHPWGQRWCSTNSLLVRFGQQRCVRWPAGPQQVQKFGGEEAVAALIAMARVNIFPECKWAKEVLQWPPSALPWCCFLAHHNFDVSYVLISGVSSSGESSQTARWDCIMGLLLPYTPTSAHPFLTIPEREKEKPFRANSSWVGLFSPLLHQDWMEQAHSPQIPLPPTPHLGVD